MPEPIFTIRSMGVADLESGIRLSSAAGWNQTEKDWKLLVENPENICLVAESGLPTCPPYDFGRRAGQAGPTIIGTTAVSIYEKRIAWISMVLVDKSYQGQGIGKSLLTEILKKIESVRSVKLDATPEGQSIYKKFDFQEEYRITRMVNLSPDTFSIDDHEGIPEVVTRKHIPEIVDLDAIVFGSSRIKLIENLIREYPTKAWVIKQNERTTGFVLGREGNSYHQIGPLVASNQLDAKILFQYAGRKLIGQPVVVDVPNKKEEWIRWLTSIGFVKERDLIRMYKGENLFPGLSEKQFLICGPEFG